MKKGLLLVIGVSAAMSLSARAPRTASGAKKMDVTLSHQVAGAEEPSFYAQANASQRQGHEFAASTGTKFTSSWNSLTVWVSQSNCLTADQALGAVMFTHRISKDWAVAGVNSGYLQQTWSMNLGGAWDSMYYDNDGVSLFRYPSGAIINPSGNTSMANAHAVITGPFTDGTSWGGYYAMDAAFQSGYDNPGNAVMSNNVNSFPRVDMQSTGGNSAWVTGGLYLDDDGTTSATQLYRGATLNHAKYNPQAGTVAWTIDSLKPAFHMDGTGAPDCYTNADIAFSADGRYGYVVFFGVQASASTPSTRAFQPIVYNTTDSGATWSSVWAPFDYTTIPVISQNIYPDAASDMKPWFSQSEGNDMVVDNNNQLHIVCCIESGYSDDNDSLGYTTTFTNIPAGNAHHYIYDVYTTGTNTWDAVLVDSMLTSATTTQSIFTYTGNPLDVDGRLQCSISSSRDHIFYFHADTDPNTAAGENAFQNVFGVGIDWSTNMKTAQKQFTFNDDAFFYFASNNALISGSTYTIPATCSLDRDGSHATETTFDHYYISGVTFDESEFTVPVGIAEAAADFGTIGTYPNPANDVLNVNINLNNNESVLITMYNALGQAVITESNEMNAGLNTVQLNTSNLESGVYFLNVTVNGSTSTQKVVIE